MIEQHNRSSSYHVLTANRVAQDTEFPGIVMGRVSRQTNFFVYDVLRENCNCLKLIQLGLTFFDATGKPAAEYPSWQFNFKFNRE